MVDDPNPINAPQLSPEQRNTFGLLDRLLGRAIADRYMDFCRLASGAFELKVSRPIAAHALRELDSMLRSVLEVPMEAKATAQQTDLNKIADARKQLATLGFDEAAIRRAEGVLGPRFSHKMQITKIAERLGLAPDGDVAKQWIALTASAGKAHQRSFHQSLGVDDEFRSKYQQPFDSVIRAVVIALQGRYTALMHRVEELAALANRAHAVSLFAKEIPGALPLQWHFFKRLETGDWLPHLVRENLLNEPIANSGEDAGEGIRFRQWPAGDYLDRMAASPDQPTRKGVIQAIQKLASSDHPDIRHDGMEIIAALPAEDAGDVIETVIAWLGREARFSMLQAPEQLVIKLADAGQSSAALKLAGALFQIWDDDQKIATLFSHHMYEYHLSSVSKALRKADGLGALRLFARLLGQAVAIKRYDSYGYTSESIADKTQPYGVTDGLLIATRRSAEAIVTTDPAQMPVVIGIFRAESGKVFTRLALIILSKAPAVASDLAEAYMLDAELIEASWCRHEYAALALAYYPSLSPEKQQLLLKLVDAIPDKYREGWKKRVVEQTGSAPPADTERRFNDSAIRDALWDWQSVLPKERQDQLERIAAELGDPDAWRNNHFPSEVSPLAASDLSAQTVPEIVEFLKSWQPAPGPQKHTVTALAQELRTAVEAEPAKFAASAGFFEGVRPIYVRRLFEGLLTVARNKTAFDWSPVIWLCGHMIDQLNQPMTFDTVAGDDSNWSWACHAALELLAAGLRLGAEGFSFEHSAQLREIVLRVMALAPKDPGLEDYEARNEQSPFFAAQATQRGMAVELCILLLLWLSKDSFNPTGLHPREALNLNPEIRQFFESGLADRTGNGRIPRAIMGRYINLLFYFGEDWLRSQFGSLLPADDPALRAAAWRPFLTDSQQPNMYIMSELHDCYSEEISRSAVSDKQPDQDYRQDSLTNHLVILYLWGGLSDDLLEQFWREAPVRMRQRAMWFLGTQLALPNLENDMRERGLAYWKRRLAAAKQASDSEPFRLELGAIGQWSLRDGLDNLWLLTELSDMLSAGLVPTDAFSVVERLQQVSSSHIDMSVSVLAALLMHPRVDRWAYMTQRDPIRAMLRSGLSSGSNATIGKVEELIGFLSTLGETSYLDLVAAKHGSSSTANAGGHESGPLAKKA